MGRVIVRLGPSHISASMRVCVFVSCWGSERLCVYIRLGIHSRNLNWNYAKKTQFSSAVSLGLKSQKVVRNNSNENEFQLKAQTKAFTRI